MKIKHFISYLLVITLLPSCAIITDEYQANQRKVIAYLLEDLPLPDDAKIIKAPTVLLGTGEAISGRIILESGFITLSIDTSNFLLSKCSTINLEPHNASVNSIVFVKNKSLFLLSNTLCLVTEISNTKSLLFEDANIIL